jgi:hypothetical protein
VTRISARFEICVWVVLAVSVQSVWGVPNNGFDTDYVYALHPAQGTSPGGELQVFKEHGTLIDNNLLPALPSPNWQSLTFAGVGDSDARLFLARNSDSTTPLGDIDIMEIDANGNTVKSTTLCAIMGIAPPLGTNRAFGNIRFSRGRPMSLFVSAACDITGTTRGMAWEIDLDLSTLRNTYTGPVTPLNQYDTTYTPFRPAHIDMAPDGRLYMSGLHLGQEVDVPNGENGLGDLVSFDTSGGSTSEFTTLVDGPTYAVTNPSWASPNSPIFRKGRPGRADGTDTVVVLMNPVEAAKPAQEMYLDTTLHGVDADGNLALRGSPMSFPRGWKGHQDPISGDIWLGALRGGVYAIRSDETTSSCQTGVQWKDAARAPFDPCNYPSADSDDDGDVDQADFATFHRCYGPNPPLDGLTISCSCFATWVTTTATGPPKVMATSTVSISRHSRTVQAARAFRPARTVPTECLRSMGS